MGKNLRPVVGGAEGRRTRPGVQAEIEKAIPAGQGDIG